MKLRITISKYHSWYLCQISLQIMLLLIQSCTTAICLKNCIQVFERILTLVLVRNFCSLFKTTSISYHILLLVGSYLLEKLRLAKTFYKTSLVLLLLFKMKVNNLNCWLFYAFMQPKNHRANIATDRVDCLIPVLWFATMWLKKPLKSQKN